MFCNRLVLLWGGRLGQQLSFTTRSKKLVCVCVFDFLYLVFADSFVSNLAITCRLVWDAKFNRTLINTFIYFFIIVIWFMLLNEIYKVSFIIWNIFPSVNHYPVNIHGMGPSIHIISYCNYVFFHSLLHWPCRWEVLHVLVQRAQASHCSIAILRP